MPVLSTTTGSSTFVSTCCGNLVSVGSNAPEYETPLGPGHAFRLTVHIDVSTERGEFSNRFRVDKTWQSRRSLTTTSWLWSHRLLSDLSSLSSKTFRNQHFLRLSQTVFQRNQPCFHGQTQTNTGSATTRDKMDT